MTDTVASRRTPGEAVPDFPPLWTGRRADDARHAFEEAIEGARSGRLGAGDVVWGDHDPVVSMAFVLEPDDALEKALQAWTLAMVACGDMIGALAPPQVAATFEYPGQILVNGGQAGSIRVASASRDRAVVPGWLVVGLTLRLMFDGSDPEPGMIPDQTSLAEEGCGDLDATTIMESFSRHFLTWIYKWQQDGFAEAHRDYVGRLEQDEETGTTRAWVQGQPLTVSLVGIDENGSLLARTDDGDTRLMWLGKSLADDGGGPDRSAGAQT